jgi:single-strand DNA-binding protein
MNNCVFLGRLTHDPEVRYVNEKAVLNFTIALNEKYKSGDKYVENVSFLDIVAWERKAEVIAEYFNKGDLILVHASARTESWEKEGQRRSKIVFRLNDFDFLTSKRESVEPEEKVVVTTANEQTKEDEIPF